MSRPKNHTSALLMIVCALASFLSGCGPDPDPKKPIELAIEGGPPPLTNSPDASFELSVSEEDVLLEASLNEGPFKETTESLLYFALPDGDYSVVVRASKGGRVTTSDAITWRVDTMPPVTELAAAPDDPNASTSATFAFSSLDPDLVYFEANLDGAGYATATSPLVLAGLSDGQHVLQLRSVDLAGNIESAITHTWTVDTAAPMTTLLSQPDTLTNNSTTVLTFTANEASSYMGSLDGAAFAPIVSPHTLPALSDGPHTFAIRATDSAGNQELVPVQIQWTIDTQPPTTTLIAVPDAQTDSPTATIHFVANEASTFQGSLDGAPLINITNPHTLTGLSEGPHTFVVRATDAAGNQELVGAATQWTVDISAPDTVITSGPPSLTSSGTAVFEFATSPVTTGVTYEAKLDGGSYQPVSTPHVVNVSNGQHTLRVRATDSVGNTDPSPAIYTWTVDSSAPTVSILVQPPSATNNPVGHFQFHSNDPSAQFQVSLNNSAFVNVGSSYNTPALGDANHSLRVRARDAAGNIGPDTLAVWEVDTVPPSIPSNLVAVRTNPTTIRLTWDDSLDNGSGLVSYHVLYDTDQSLLPYDGVGAPSGDSPIDTASTNTFFDFDALSCMLHYTAIVAIDAAGNESGISNEAQISTGECGGNGEFALSNTNAVLGTPVVIKRGDFNADNIEDLAVATEQSGGTLRILLGNGSNGRGNGTFSLGQSTLLGSLPRDMVVADYTQDGILDIVVVRQNNLNIFYGVGANGVGTGQFQNSQCPPTCPSISQDVVEIEIGYLDADHILDLVFLTVDGIAHVYKGEVNSTYAIVPDTSGSTFALAAAPAGLELADFNGDGILDLMEYTNSGLVVVYNGLGTNGRGNGDFATQNASTYSLAIQPSDVAVRDLDGDSLLDVAVASVDGKVQILFGNGNGSFVGGSVLDLQSPLTSIVAGDYNADKIIDLGVTDDFGGVHILIGSGQNGVGSGNYVATSVVSTAAGATSLITGDFDADGVTDLALANQSTNRVSILIGEGGNGRGDASFAAPQPNSIRTLPNTDDRGLVTADFNSDGILDIAISVSTSVQSQIAVALGNGSDGRGDGSFAPPSYRSVPTTLGVDTLVAGDFNSDGIVDIAALGLHAVYILDGLGANGLGNGSFAPARTFSIGVGFLGVDMVSVDLDRDDIQDLVVSTRNPNDGLSVLLGSGSNGQGDGNFISAAHYAFNNFGIPAMSRMTTGDFNADGLPDFALSGDGIGATGLIVAIADGQDCIWDSDFDVAFYAVQGAAFVEAITVADFNSDGITDVAIAADGSVVSILTGDGTDGRGDGAFTLLPGSVAIAPASGALLAHDLNHDGRVDLVAGSGGLAIARGDGVDAGRGNGTFLAPLVVPDAARNTYLIVSGDYNGDGITDVAAVGTNVAATFPTTQIYVFAGGGVIE